MGLLGDMVVRIVGDTADFVRKIDQSGQKLKGFEKDIKKLTDTMSRLGKQMTMFVTLPIVAAGVAAVKTAAEFEKQTVAFEVMLGSAEKAKKLLGEIEQFSAITPFQLPQLIEGSKRLLAFGTAADNIVETMRNLGNAAMGDAAKLDQLVLAFGKVQARGKASMRELNMFLYAGVPIIEELSKNLGVAKQEIFKMSEQGKISFKDVNHALQTLTTGSGRFAGLIEKQSQTMSGLWSTMKDNIGLLAKSFGEILLPALKRIVANFTAWAQRMREMDIGQKKTILTILALAAAIGPGLIIIAKLIKIVQMLRTAFLAVNAVMMANPWILITAGVVALGFAIYKLVEIGNTEKRLDRDIIDLKKELIAARGNERLRIQETIVAKLREAYVTAQAQALEAQGAADRLREIRETDKYTKGLTQVQSQLNAQIAGFTTKAEKAMKTAGNLREQFEKENEILVTLTETERKAAQGTLVLEDEIEDASDAADKAWKARVDAIDAETTAAMESYQLRLDSEQAFREEMARIQEEREAQRRAAVDKYVADLNTEVEAEREAIRQSNYEAIFLQDAKEREAAAARQKEIEAETLHQQQMAQIRQAAFSTISGIITAISGYWDSYYSDLLANENLTDKQKRKLQHEQAARAKSFALFNATITGAEAILSALATKPFWLGLTLAALAGVLTAVQIGAIAAQPLPKLAKGGKLTRPTMVMAGEAGPEYFIPELALDELGGRIAGALRSATINNTITNDQPVVLSINLDGRQLDAHVERSISNRKILVRRDSVA